VATVHLSEAYSFSDGLARNKEAWDMSIKKALAAARQASSPKAPEPSSCPVLKGCPTVWDFLTVTTVEGKSRMTSTISMWVQDGALTLCLNERDQNLSLFATGADLEEAYNELQAHLESDSPPWRRQGKRVKK
jgi:hypothetical protein